MEALSPIPNPLPNDDEDVSWALSTAGALWARGERSEALKWLRRAAEQASDANDDVRALALFKAAADVSTQVSTTTPPPPPSSSIAPPSLSVTPPPPASVAPSTSAPSTSVTPPPAAAIATSASSPPPSPRASVPPPPARKGPPSLPPRNSRPPLPPSRSQAPPPASTQAPPPPSTQFAPPQAAPPQPGPPPGASAPRSVPAPPPPRARQVHSTEAPPVTKVSRVPGPSSAPQISPTARSTAANSLADAAVPVRRPEGAPQRSAAPARPAVTGATVPTRPVAFAPSPVTTPLPPVATERLPPSRRGRVFDELLGIPPAPGGQGFDDLDENTQVIQAARTVPIARKSPAQELEESTVPIGRKSTAQEVEESFHGLLADPRAADADAVDEPTDPGLNTRVLDTSSNDEVTGPVSVPERTAVWTPAERAALMAASENGPEITSRRFAPLLAHRVAVVASSTPGELRLVPLDTYAAPPAGAAIALLVPLSAADDDVVARLLGSLE